MNSGLPVIDRVGLRQGALLNYPACQRSMLSRDLFKGSSGGASYRQSIYT